MNLPNIKIEELLEAGVHFGHNVRRWNPKMEEYIFGVRNNIHIFDLRITAEAISNALLKLHETVTKSGKVLFVGTKKQCAEVVKELASLNKDFYVFTGSTVGVVPFKGKGLYKGTVDKIGSVSVNIR